MTDKQQLERFIEIYTSLDECDKALFEWKMVRIFARSRPALAAEVLLTFLLPRFVLPALAVLLAVLLLAAVMR